LYLKQLSLFQFKNHSESSFTFNEKINCFVGDNGVGKTNILDAIHYLSLTKSYFNHIDAQNIQFGNQFFILKGHFNNKNQEDEIQCNFNIGAGKIIKKNQKRYKRFSEHIGQYPIIIISPTDSNLILEGSEIRRKYLDSSISQFQRSYLKQLIDYNKVLKQRNRLLKQFTERNYFDPITLENYDNQLVSHGIEIYSQRQSFLEKLTPVFDNYYKKISSARETVTLSYRSQLHEGDFATLLKESLMKDKISHHTSVGIHKDDIIFEMNKHPVKKIGSQGQQKSFLISLKLAQFEFITQKLGFKPILLLDDIFDKLDDKRVEQLITFTSQGAFSQVFITDTHEKRSRDILKRTGVDFEIFKIDSN
jgi:DNA replication and repair protein RecF